MIKPFRVRIEADSALPVYEQIKGAIVLAILSGRLVQDDQVPSIRDLAARLKVNPNTVIKVYERLEAEGFLKTRAGSGCTKRLSGRSWAACLRCSWCIRSTWQPITPGSPG